MMRKDGFAQNAQQIAEEAITASGGLPDEYVVNPIDEQNGGELAARDREWDVNIDKLFDNPRREEAGPSLCAPFGLLSGVRLSRGFRMDKRLTAERNGALPSTPKPCNSPLQTSTSQPLTKLLAFAIASASS